MVDCPCALSLTGDSDRVTGLVGTDGLIAGLEQVSFGCTSFLTFLRGNSSEQELDSFEQLFGRLIPRPESSNDWVSKSVGKDAPDRVSSAGLAVIGVLTQLLIGDATGAEMFSTATGTEVAGTPAKTGGVG